MSNLIDKIRTLLNAQLRGPRHVHKPQAQTAEQPLDPSATSGQQVPEVTEGRQRKPKAEVSESAPPPAQQQKAAPPRPLARDALAAPTDQSGDLDKGRVADMLKKKHK